MSGNTVVVELDRRIIDLLTRVLNTEYKRLQLELEITEERIKRFEDKYGMSSSEFMERYTRGELGDKEEYMEWYGELKFLERIRNELEEPKKVANHVSGKIPKHELRKS